MLSDTDAACVAIALAVCLERKKRIPARPENGTKLNRPDPCNRRLTLRLLMSYIYGAPSKARNANVVYIYGPTFGNAETVSFYLLHNVSTPNQCREVSCVTFVCKHFAS